MFRKFFALPVLAAVGALTLAVGPAGATTPAVTVTASCRDGRLSAAALVSIPFTFPVTDAEVFGHVTDTDGTVHQLDHHFGPLDGGTTSKPWPMPASPGAVVHIAVQVTAAQIEGGARASDPIDVTLPACPAAASTTVATVPASTTTTAAAQPATTTTTVEVATPTSILREPNVPQVFPTTTVRPAPPASVTGFVEHATVSEDGQLPRTGAGRLLWWLLAFAAGLTLVGASMVTAGRWPNPPHLAGVCTVIAAMGAVLGLSVSMLGWVVPGAVLGLALVATYGTLAVLVARGRRPVVH